MVLVPSREPLFRAGSEALARGVPAVHPTVGWWRVPSRCGQPCRSPRVPRLAASQDHTGAGGAARRRPASRAGPAPQRGRRTGRRQRRIPRQARTRQPRRRLVRRARSRRPRAPARRRRTRPPAPPGPDRRGSGRARPATAARRQAVDAAPESAVDVGRDHRRARVRQQRAAGRAGREPARPRLLQRHVCRWFATEHGPLPLPGPGVAQLLRRLGPGCGHHRGRPAHRSRPQPARQGPVRPRRGAVHPQRRVPRPRNHAWPASEPITHGPEWTARYRRISRY